jgi:hypothetical protein
LCVRLELSNIRLRLRIERRCRNKQNRNDQAGSKGAFA